MGLGFQAYAATVSDAQRHVHRWGEGVKEDGLGICHGVSRVEGEGLREGGRAGDRKWVSE